MQREDGPEFVFSFVAYFSVNKSVALLMGYVTSIFAVFICYIFWYYIIMTKLEILCENVCKKMPGNPMPLHSVSKRSRICCYPHYGLTSYPLSFLCYHCFHVNFTSTCYYFCFECFAVMSASFLNGLV